MKEPGLDGRHRNEDGRIHEKRGDTQNQHLSRPIAGFPPTTTLEEMRKATGKESIEDVREAAEKLHKRK